MNIEEINAVLALLNSDDATHWLEDGRPNPDVVYQLVGNPISIEQGQMNAYIQWAAPDFRKPEAKKPAVVKATKKDAKVEAVIVEETASETLSEVDKAAAIVATAEKAANDAAKILRQAQIEHDALVEKSAKESKGDPIAEYLERQKANLASRVEKLAFLRENRELLKDVLNVKSPIDNMLGSRKRNS